MPRNKNNRWLLIMGSILITLGLIAIIFHKYPQDTVVINLPEQPTIIFEEPTDIDFEKNEPTIVDQIPENNLQDQETVKIDDLPVENTVILPDPIENQACDYHLFFDIRNILLESSGSAAAKEVGVSNMFWYTVKHKQTPNHIEIQNRLFEFMDYCTQKPRGQALLNNEPMPYLMCKWIGGKITAQQLIETILTFKKEIKDFFISEEEKNLVLGTLNLLKPEIICKIQKPNIKMIHLFQRYCKSLPNKIYILSNWDSESLELIYKQYPEIFDKLNKDHILISGDIGKLKPEVDLFNHITNQLKLNPSSCILIDDRPENIRVANNLNWKTVLYKDIEDTKKELSKLVYDEICDQNQNITKKKIKKKKKNR